MHTSLFGATAKKTDDEINAGDRKYIKCTFIEAKDLMDVSKNGRPEPVIDAYIFTSLGSGHKVSKEEYITKSNKQTLTPAWRETCTFGSEFDLTNQDLDPHLIIDIYNKSDKMPMGTIDLPVSTLTSVQDKWFPLQKCGGMTAIRGQLKCTIEVTVPGTDDARQTNYDLLGVNAVDDKKYEEQAPNELHIVVLKSKRLLACDTGARAYIPVLIHTCAHTYMCSYIHVLIHTCAHTYMCLYVYSYRFHAVWPVRPIS